MNDRSDALTEEALLAELGWIRRLARSLVRDASTAEDLVQETYLHALEQPPGSAQGRDGWRGWLARVLRTRARTRWRSEERRRRREALVARPERDDADLVADVELRRTVVSAVLALDEPHRTTLLRHAFEGRTVAEMAALAGVSPEAIRQRLTRARRALRSELERRLGADEGGWRHALAPLLALPEGSSSPDEETAPQRVPHPARRLLLPFAAVLLALLGALFGRRLVTLRGALEDLYAANDAAPELVPDRDAAFRRGGLARWLVRPPGTGRSDERSGASQQAGAANAEQGSAALLRHASFLGAPREERSLARRLSDDLSLDVDDVVAREVTPRLARDVARQSGHPHELVRRAELYDATSIHPRRGQVSRRVVRMPLDPDDEDVRLTVLVGDGRAITMGAWGNASFDDDPDLRWVAYLGQILKVQDDETPLSLASPSAADLAERMRAWNAQEGPDSRFLRALLAQRVAMAGNAVVLRSRQMVERGGAPPPALWYADLAKRMQALAKLSPDLALVTGETAAQRHAEHARELASAYAALASALEGADDGAVEQQSARLSAACKACHGEPTEDGTSFFESFEPFVTELGLPIGQIVLELDIAPAPGEDGTWSARVATAFRAAMMLANES